MDENPYTAMVEAMRGAARAGSAPGWRLGAVRSVSPLRVETGGLAVGPDGLFVNPETLSEIKAGDSVVLLPSEDEQELYLICRVVTV